jgi:hypothetical protein
MSQTIEDFAHALLGLKKNETEKAVAYMWYQNYHDSPRKFDLQEIISGLNEVGLLVKAVNNNRLGGNLRKHKLV